MPPAAAPIAAPSSPLPDWCPMTPPSIPPAIAPVAVSRCALDAPGPYGFAQFESVRAEAAVMIVSIVFFMVLFMLLLVDLG